MVRLGRVFGAESIWLADHLMGWFPRALWTKDFSWLARGGRSPHAFYEWQVLAGHLAGQVGSMRLGIGVTEPLRRHPVVLAQAALTLSHLTRSAPILGLGAGEAENVVPYGLSFDRPVSRLEEALQVARLCLDAEGPLHFAGEHFTLDGALMDLRPPDGRRPEIWVAAHGPRMLELCGRYGDGWFPAFPMPPAAYASSLTAIRTAAVAAGRHPEAIVPSLEAFVVLGRSEKVARSYLEHRAVRFLALLAPDSMWREAGSEHPLGAGHRGAVDFIPHRHSADEMEAGIGRVPPDLLGARVIWGTPDQVVDQIQALAAAGLRHVVLAPVSGLVSRRAAFDAVRALPGMIRRLRSGT